ncbi:reverse transcriptase domain-containing protein [Tanacetum coccineum]
MHCGLILIRNNGNLFISDLGFIGSDLGWLMMDFWGFSWQEASLDYLNFSQGTFTVEELINEFDRLRMRCDANEEEEQVVARFLGVIRPEIADVWSIQKIISFVEEESKVIYDTDGNDVDESPEFKLLRPDLGESLVIHRVLSVAPSKSIDDDSWRRNNIFRTKCTSKGKVCNMIIDGGSCENVVSTYMVEKLAKIVDHPEPYQLTWLKKGNTVKVSKRCLVHFSIGKKYSDEVWCEVVPMDACHILLGRPWQFDRKTKHGIFLTRIVYEKVG